MKTYLLTISAIASFAILYATPAQAQATRTWVSGVGDDANPCSRTAPCKTFPGAISKTATGGEINVLDPGGFGTVTITKAISIKSDHIEAGVLAAGVNGIVISSVIPAGAKVLLQGLDIDGVNQSTSPGLTGVQIQGAAKVTIQDCSIRNFSQNGVNIAGPAGTRVVIEKSFISGNNTGVAIAGVSGAANAAVVLGTTIDNHPTASITVAAGSSLILGGSKLLGSTASVTNAGTFTSFGDNELGGTGTPTSTIALR